MQALTGMEIRIMSERALETSTQEYGDQSEAPDARPQEQIDPFDVSRFRLSQDYASTVGVVKALLTVPVRKPERQTFARVHPDEGWRMTTALVELKEERECYLVDPAMYSELASEVAPMILFAAITRQGDPFFWPVKLPKSDGRQNEWNRSALEAAQMAMTQWIRVQANMAIGAYEIFKATGDIPDPVWPDVGFEGLIKIAFKGRVIRTPDHPVVRKLRGDL
jgi:hypothetical protein